MGMTGSAERGRASTDSALNVPSATDRRLRRWLTPDRDAHNDGPRTPFNPTRTGDLRRPRGPSPHAARQRRCCKSPTMRLVPSTPARERGGRRRGRTQMLQGPAAGREDEHRASNSASQVAATSMHARGRRRSVGLGVASAIRGPIKAVFEVLHPFPQSRYGLFDRFESALSVRCECRDVLAADAGVVRCHAETPRWCWLRPRRCTRRGHRL